MMKIKKRSVTLALLLLLISVFVFSERTQEASLDCRTYLNGTRTIEDEPYYLIERGWPLTSATTDYCTYRAEQTLSNINYIGAITNLIIYTLLITALSTGVGNINLKPKKRDRSSKD